MKFSIEPSIFKTFPGVMLGVIVIDSMDNHGHSDSVLQLLRNEEAKQHELLKETDIGILPEIASWRRIYKAFGADTHDCKSSIEALLRRAKKGAKPLPQINNLVDMYNYLSIKYHLPLGAEDLDKIQGDIQLRFSLGTESGRALGTEVDETCVPGEVVYSDDAGFICRRWNWREADRTKITEDTTRAVMVIEQVPEAGSPALKAALDESSLLIEDLLHGTCRTYMMHSDLVSVDIS